MSIEASATARRQFARRLRELRVARGFKTARSLAGALGIDENRYTRYERAEVEPDIALIQRICETLCLSPNELFGVTPHERPVIPSGLAEGTKEYSAEAPSGTPRNGRSEVAWLLASKVAELQSRSANQGNGGKPLARLQQAARLFTDLERRPYAAVSEILLMPAVTGASPEEARLIGELVEELTRAKPS